MLNKSRKGSEVLQTRSLNLAPRQRTLLLLVNGLRTNAELLKQTAGLGATQEDLNFLLLAGLIFETDFTQQTQGLDSLPLSPQAHLTHTTHDQASNELNDLRQAAFKVRDEESSLRTMPMSTNLSRPMTSPITAPMSAPESQPSIPVENLPPMTNAERFVEAQRAATKLSSELGLKAFRLQLALERAADIDEIRELRTRLLEALVKESGEREAYKRLRPLDRLLRST